MKSTKRRIGFACGFFLLLGACFVGGGHTTDARLLENFATHEVEFETLLAEVRADSGLEMLRDDVVRYAGHTFSGQDSLQEAEALGLTHARWLRY